MRILWIPQLSSVRDNMYHLDSDSNWNFFVNLTTGINEITDNIHIIIALPYNTNVSQSASKYLKDFEVIWMEKTTDVFGSRFDFSFNQACELLKQIQPDILFENNPTLVRNWKTVIISLGLDIPIITYFHWVDVPSCPKAPEEISYWFRQIDGAITADLVYFNSDYGVNQFIENVFDTIGNNCQLFWKRKGNIKKLYPPVNLNIEKYRCEKSKEPSIVFNHRLSSFKIYKENLQFFIAALERFYKRHNFIPKVYFTNPSRKDVPKFSFKFEVVDLQLDEYYKFLGSDKVNIAPNFFLTSENQWSIATVEAGFLGNAVIMPRKFGYKEIMPLDYEGYFNNFEEGANLLEKCILDDEFRLKLAERFIKEIQTIADYKIAHEFVNDLIKLQERCM